MDGFFGHCTTHGDLLPPFFPGRQQSLQLICWRFFSLPKTNISCGLVSSNQACFDLQQDIPPGKLAAPQKGKFIGLPSIFFRGVLGRSSFFPGDGAHGAQIYQTLGSSTSKDDSIRNWDSKTPRISKNIWIFWIFSTSDFLHGIKFNKT